MPDTIDTWIDVPNIAKLINRSESQTRSLLAKPHAPKPVSVARHDGKGAGRRYLFSRKEITAWAAAQPRQFSGKVAVKPVNTEEGLVTVAGICELAGLSESRIRAMLAKPGAPSYKVYAKKIQGGCIPGRYSLDEVELWLKNRKRPIDLIRPIRTSDFTAAFALFTDRERLKNEARWKREREEEAA